MLSAIENILPIFLAFILGFNQKKWIKTVNLKLITRLSSWTLYCLLLMMGITIGEIPGILHQLATVGYYALVLAVFTSAMIFIVLKLVTRRTKASKTTQKKDQADTAHIIEHIKEPAMLASLVIIGFMVGYFELVPPFELDHMISGLLYLLIYLIAVKLSFSGLNIKSMLLNRHNILFSFLCIFASYIGAFIAALFLPLSMSDSLAISSGFGWYSLSGILFAKMDAPLLGSIAFLCDLFREMIALLLTPMLCRIGQANAAIGIAGATAMDVNLPVIEKHCGTQCIPLAILYGGILTILVPFFIPFFYSLSI